MIPRQSIDTRLAQARDDVARRVVTLAERTKDCREAKRQMFEARDDSGAAVSGSRLRRTPRGFTNARPLDGRR